MASRCSGLAPLVSSIYVGKSSKLTLPGLQRSVQKWMIYGASMDKGERHSFGQFTGVAGMAGMVRSRHGGYDEDGV